MSIIQGPFSCRAVPNKPLVSRFATFHRRTTAGGSAALQLTVSLSHTLTVCLSLLTGLNDKKAPRKSAAAGGASACKPPAAAGLKAGSKLVSAVTNVYLVNRPAEDLVEVGIQVRLSLQPLAQVRIELVALRVARFGACPCVSLTLLLPGTWGLHAGAGGGLERQVADGGVLYVCCKAAEGNGVAGGCELPFLTQALSPSPFLRRLRARPRSDEGRRRELPRCSARAHRRAWWSCKRAPARRLARRSSRRRAQMRGWCTPRRRVLR